MVGLLLIVVDLMSRLQVNTKKLAWAMTALLLLAAAAAHARAGVWADPIALWQDTVSKSPQKRRDHFQLGSAYFETGRCDLAEQEFEKTAQLGKVDYDLLVDWGLAYDCLNRPGDAVSKLRQAAALEPTAHVYSQIGMVFAKRAQWGDALQALNAAQKIDPNYAMTYYYLGGVYLSLNQPAQAAASYQRSLQLQPGYQPAVDGLAQSEARLRAGR
jgi:tetratricopeptide (TPR) repeat protein